MSSSSSTSPHLPQPLSPGSSDRARAGRIVPPPPLAWRAQAHACSLAAPRLARLQPIASSALPESLRLGSPMAEMATNFSPASSPSALRTSPTSDITNPQPELLPGVLSLFLTEIAAHLTMDLNPSLSMCGLLGFNLLQVLDNLAVVVAARYLSLPVARLTRGLSVAVKRRERLGWGRGEVEEEDDTWGSHVGQPSHRAPFPPCNGPAHEQQTSQRLDASSPSPSFRPSGTTVILPLYCHGSQPFKAPSPRALRRLPIFLSSLRTPSLSSRPPLRLQRAHTPLPPRPVSPRNAPMETPLSTRRITRSLAAAAAASARDRGGLRRRRPDPAGQDRRRCGGDAAARRAARHHQRLPHPCCSTAPDKTPASTAAKTRRRAPRRTPGSGEALLRGQVKALLHKVEEEQGCAAPEALVRPAARIQALLGLLAPTPANTPQIVPVSVARDGLLVPDGVPVVPCVLKEELLLPKLQVIAASLPPTQPKENLGECQLNRALSDASDGSAVSFQVSSTGSCMGKSSPPEDDSSSAWSIQVHASSEKGDEELLGVEELEGEYTEEEDWEEEDSDDDCFDDLCEEMSRMTVVDEEERKAGLPQFEGKHTRFIYNSDDEIERRRAELAALVLRGMPVPQGRHLRFHDDEEDEK
ncbi:hypothetical protein HU200_000658 [Digitaria exilis]|uniref:Uncharacterized protein n=1 Tax=Digitaria exilis TaxID=1010633 RepID=A0A835FYJ4_9POAL|nr:hypothetical protein HU200_000658 [Digitaria exilis]